MCANVECRAFFFGDDVFVSIHDSAVVSGNFMQKFTICALTHTHSLSQSVVHLHSALPVLFFCDFIFVLKILSSFFVAIFVFLVILSATCRFAHASACIRAHINTTLSLSGILTLSLSLFYYVL